MFEGYEDPVLQIYSSFEFDEEEDEDAFFEEEETTPAPPKIPMDKFGWFYKVGCFFKRWIWRMVFAEEWDNMVGRGPADAHRPGRHGEAGTDCLLEPKQSNWCI